MLESHHSVSSILLMFLCFSQSAMNSSFGNGDTTSKVDPYKHTDAHTIYFMYEFVMDEQLSYYYHYDILCKFNRKTQLVVLLIVRKTTMKCA